MKHHLLAAVALLLLAQRGADALAAPTGRFDPRVSPHEYGRPPTQKVGVIVVDHGSKRTESNARLEALCAAYQRRNRDWVVRAAHMEIASPSIGDALESCAAAGCELVVCHPFFLGPGKHASDDVPRLLRAANDRFPHVTTVLTEPLGANPHVLDVVHDSVKRTVDRHSAPDDSFENSFFGSIQAAMKKQQTQRGASSAAASEEEADS